MSTWALIVVAIAFALIGIWFAQREEAQKEDALDAPLLAADEQVEPTPAAPLASIEPSPQREPASEFPDARTSRPTATTAGRRSHGLVLIEDAAKLAVILGYDAQKVGAGREGHGERPDYTS